MAIIDKFFVALGYKYDESRLKKFNSFVAKTIDLMKKLALSAVGLTTAFALLMITFVKHIAQTIKLSKRYGILRRDLIGLRRESERLTGNESVGEDLLGRFRQESAGRDAGRPFDENLEEIGSRLGVNMDRIIRSGEKGLIDLAKAIRGASDFTREAVVGLGFSREDIQFLMGLTQASLDRSKPSKTRVAELLALDEAIRKVKEKFTDLAENVLARFVPVILGLTTKLREWLNTITGEDINNFVDNIIVEGKRLLEALKTIVFELEKFVELFKSEEVDKSGTVSEFLDREVEKQRVGPPKPDFFRGRIDRNRIGKFEQKNEISLNVTTNSDDPQTISTAINVGLTSTLSRLADEMNSGELA